MRWMCGLYSWIGQCQPHAVFTYLVCTEECFSSTCLSSSGLPFFSQENTEGFACSTQPDQGHTQGTASKRGGV